MPNLAMLTGMATLVTVGQIAERFGVDRTTVHQWKLKGRLTPVMRLPGQTGALLFDLADVDRLAADMAGAETSEATA